MLDFVRKTLVFDYADSNGGKAEHFNQALFQRAAVHSLLSGIQLSRIGALGKRALEVVEPFQSYNECLSVTMADNQPAQFATLNDDGSADSYQPVNGSDVRYDALYSCGVLNSISTDKLGEFLDVTTKMLLPGGLQIHVFDYYLGVNPTPFWKDRLKPFHALLEREDIEGIGPAIDEADLCFSPDMASSSDGSMYGLYAMGGGMAALRRDAQHVALVFGARRLA